MSVTPRPYQLDAAAAVVQTWEEHPDRGALLVMATGLGKTFTGLLLAVRECLDKGGRLVWLAHREELVVQAYQSLVKGWTKHGLRAGIVQANRDACNARAVFASVMTLAQPKRMERLLRSGAPTLVVVDEAHHSPSDSHTKVIEQLTAGGARLLGLTATPEREDGKDLGESWEIAYSMGIIDAIEGGWLTVPYAAEHPIEDLDLSEVSGRRDYDDAELGAALLKAHIVEHTVAAMGEVLGAERLPWRDGVRQMTAKGRSCIVFTATVEQAKLTAVALTNAGWRAGWVCGETPGHERRALLHKFATGQIDVLCNAAVLTEGTDLPRCSCVVLARPTRSWPLMVQMTGRGLRLHDPAWDRANGPMNALHEAYRGDREALILDLAGATRLHSLVSAPVLIGGTSCDKSPHGGHDFEKAKEGKAVCAHCGTKRACWEALQADKPGHHEYPPTGPAFCKHCGKAQCPDSEPDRRHIWIPQPEHKRLCMMCGTEGRDPLASLVRERREAESTDDTALMRLTGLEPETWAVDLDKHGIVLISGDREADRWQPVWVPTGGRKGRPLTDGKVEGRLAWAVGKDVIRKAGKSGDYRRQMALFGGHPSETAREKSRNKASELAVRIGIARRAA